MSVWQCPPSASLLSGSEGELVSVSITVDPRDLEGLLEALAHVDFPINPQLYHGASTIVDFPAYAGRLPQVRAALADCGIGASAVRVASMLEQIQSLMDNQTSGRGDDADYPRD